MRAPSAATAKPTAWTLAIREQFGSAGATTRLHYVVSCRDIIWSLLCANWHRGGRHGLCSARPALSLDPFVVAILGPGQFFGEGCLNGHPLRIATTAAIDECVITRLDKAVTAT
jgi:hypothetical protein